MNRLTGPILEGDNDVDGLLHVDVVGKHAGRSVLKNLVLAEISVAARAASREEKRAEDKGSGY